MPHVLYNGTKTVPTICERPDWRNCPEHKHLSLKRPRVPQTVQIFEELDSITGSFETDDYFNYDEVNSVSFEGKIFNKEKLVKAGFDKNKVEQAFSRPMGDSDIPPSDDAKILRIEALVHEKNFNDTYDAIVNKKFPLFTSKKDKQEYYTQSMKKLEENADILGEAYNQVMYVEQTREWSFDTSHRSRMSLDHYGIQDGPDDSLLIPEKTAYRSALDKTMQLKRQLKDKKLI